MKASKWQIFKYKWINKHCRHFCCFCKYKEYCHIDFDANRLDGREAEMIIKEYNEFWLRRAEPVDEIRLQPFLSFLHDRGLLDMKEIYKQYKGKCVIIECDTHTGTTYK